MGSQNTFVEHSAIVRLRSADLRRRRQQLLREARPTSQPPGSTLIKTSSGLKRYRVVGWSVQSCVKPDRAVGNCAGIWLLDSQANDLVHTDG